MVSRGYYSYGCCYVYEIASKLIACPSFVIAMLVNAIFILSVSAKHLHRKANIGMPCILLLVETLDRINKNHKNSGNKIMAYVLYYLHVLLQYLVSRDISSSITMASCRYNLF